MSDKIKDKLLSTKELAEYLGISEWTIAHYRTYGTGPEYLKLGNYVRYKVSDIEAWLEKKKRELFA